jgi:hypothetical protein
MHWKFWKKEDDLGLPELGGYKAEGFNANSFGQQSTGLDLSDSFQPGNGGGGGGQFGAPPQQQYPPTNGFGQGFTPPAYAPGVVPPSAGQDLEDHHQQNISKDLQVIAAKLDTIRAQLEMLNTRVGNLERDQNGPQGKRPWY